MRDHPQTMAMQQLQGSGARQMSDLVKRLRDYATNLGGPPEDYLTWQAADRIEALEAALRYIAREGDHISRGTICDRASAALAPE